MKPTNLTLLLGTAFLFAAILPTASATAPKEPKGKVLIVLTNHDRLGNTGKQTGYYLSEAAHPYKVFVDAGYVAEFASPKGGLAPIDPSSLPGRGGSEDEANKAFLSNTDVSKQTAATKKLSDIVPAEYSAVFFAGGHGTMWDFPGDAGVQMVAAGVYQGGGVVAAVCHGPAALVDVKLADGSFLVAGKTVSSFTDEEEAAVSLTNVVPFLLESKLRERGATFVESPVFQPRVAVSERLVTGQNPASATGVAEAVVKLLEDRPTTKPSK